MTTPDPADGAARDAHAPAVSVHNLVKRYGDIEAVAGIDLEVAAGRDLRLPRPQRRRQVHHHRHPVHPGRPDRRLGHAWPATTSCSERDEVRRNIGLVFQDTTLDAYLTAEQNLRFHAELYGVPRDVLGDRLRQVLEMVGPLGAARQPGR